MSRYRLWLSWEGSTLPSAQRYDLEKSLRVRLVEGPTLRLADLAATEAGREDWEGPPGQGVRIVAAETVIDYAVATYGRERLPALVRGLGQYETWEALLPAVFGVPASDFEAGWQAYLVAR